MDNTLFADILKAHDNLNEIEFTVNGNKHKFYYRYMTILEHTRIKMSCIRRNEHIKQDGTKTIKEEENSHLYPIYAILEKAMDKDGKKLYSLTNMEAFNMFSKMPFELLSYISAEMTFDITGNINSTFNKAE